jgi:hypothetical protein
MTMANDVFGKAGDTDKILEKRSTKVEGQAMSEENRKRAAAAIAAQGAESDILAAAGFTEEIIAFLNKEWNEREFTAEQRIFSVALATVNLRQHYPANLGGKETFDAVAKTAWDYFDKNK